MRLFLCGDVMTGRGIDQILPAPCDPELHEEYVQSALDYVALAERENGPIPRPAGFDYIWGDLLAELDQFSPDLRIVNLETAITADGVPEPKGINYRMHPGNVGCLVAAGIDCCALANNHLLDWGRSGVEETLKTLAGADIATAGAGCDAEAAAAPAVLGGVSARRVLVYAFACPTSGVPLSWQAADGTAGVNVLAELDDAAVRRIARHIAGQARAGDLVIASIHWGSNWGYQIPAAHRRFARALIDEAGIHVVHGHSSHHPKAIEVHAGHPILYGCGDLINDYEGIRGYEAFRSHLVLAYLADFDEADGRMRRLETVPFAVRNFRLTRASAEEAEWLRATLDRECRPLGHSIELDENGHLILV